MEEFLLEALDDIFLLGPDSNVLLEHAWESEKRVSIKSIVLLRPGLNVINKFIFAYRN